MYFFESCFATFTGFMLGFTIYAFGDFMDHWIALSSRDTLIRTKGDLLREADAAVFTNLCLISPIVYSCVSQTLLNTSLRFSISHYLFLLTVQNTGYYMVHYMMHNNQLLYKIHVFHHRFDTVTIPSSGNAVSSIEFITAYIAPFVIGALLVQPTEVTYLASIGTVAFLNMVIHTYEWKDSWWMPFLISPEKHIDHHRRRFVHYAAPLLDIDRIVNLFYGNTQKIEKQN